MDLIPLGQMLGVPIFANWTALLMLGFIVLQGGTGSSAEIARGLLFGVMVFLSVLVHELGHAVVGQRMGLRPQRILLHGFGGLTSYGRSPRPSEGVFSSLAGPAAGLALGVLTWGLMHLVEDRAPPVALWLLENMVYINIFWSLFNLVPMWPLDGGHLLWYGLRLKLPGGRSWSITRIVGLVAAAGVVAFGWVSGQNFLILVAGLSIRDLLMRP